MLIKHLILFTTLFAYNAITFASENRLNEGSSKEVVDMLKGKNEYFSPPDETTIPNDKYGADVRLGLNIFTKTKEYANRYVGNGLVCSNCHLDRGRKPHAAPMWAAYSMYPAYRARDDRNINLAERIQQCFRFSLNGFAPAFDAPEIRALISYMHFLSSNVPVGKQMPGRGFPQIMKTGFDPSPSRGEIIYKSKCVECHGANGEGKTENTGKFIYPPLWGKNAFNKAAGFSRITLLAGFIKANMPFGQEWSLTDQESLDLAAYINLQIRPWDPRKGFLKSLFN